MKKFIKEKYKLFCTALLQVLFVCMNVVYIAKGEIILMLISSFLVSFIWSFNIKKVAFGTMSDRIVYSTGALAGSCLGYYLSSSLLYIS